eukprot:TRINITY_DN3272_c0_g1_i1.p1 TRINITY_DN3272_c0_g1~~TRINITY_DN3272_c0_g1_i1.p1  ORF type:complete len:329 (-),score=61.83 TRINITY_DN3272_c0_g1_i1:951-1937(-)
MTLNAMLCAYAQNEGYFEKAIELFQTMKEKKINMNEYTWSSMISICGFNKKLEFLKSIHQEILENGQMTEILLNGLITSYSKCGHIKQSIEIFGSLQKGNIHSTTYNAMLSAYSRSEGYFEKAIELFHMMKDQKVNLNEYTWSSMVSICGLNKKLDCLKSIHQEIIESGQTITDFLFSGLIISYSKCGKIEESIEIFNNTSKNSLIYNSMLIAYSQEEGYSEEALSVFFQMKERKITLNEYTWSSMISVCGINGKIVSLKKIHQELIESGFPLTSILFSELISAYAKCGFYDVSLSLFSQVPEVLKTNYIWNQILLIYGNFRLIKEAA